jgi:hypothetical protein
MKIALLASISLLSLGAIPAAHAAESIDCVKDRLNPETRDLWGNTVLRGAAGDKDEASASAALQDVMRSAYKVITACASEKKWTGPAINAVVAYSGYSAALPILRKRMRVEGQDPSSVDAAFDELSPQTRRNIVSSAIARSAKSAVEAALRRHGFSGDFDNIAPEMENVFTYLIFRCLIQEEEAKFAAA